MSLSLSIQHVHKSICKTSIFPWPCDFRLSPSYPFLFPLHNETAKQPNQMTVMALNYECGSQIIQLYSIYNPQSRGRGEFLLSLSHYSWF